MKHSPKFTYDELTDLRVALNAAPTKEAKAVIEILDNALATLERDEELKSIAVSLSKEQWEMLDLCFYDYHEATLNSDLSELRRRIERKVDTIQGHEIDESEVEELDGYEP